jgi:tetratricopeptide (TPR) repeat protein
MNSISGSVPPEAYAAAHSAYAAEAYDDAIQRCDAMLATDENYAPAYNIRGLALQQKKDFKAALQDLQRAVRINPQSAEYQHNLGGVQLACGLLDDALVSLQRSFELGHYPSTQAMLREASLAKYLQQHKQQKPRLINTAKRAVPKVIIYSWDHISNNYGDRLPYHLATTLFPPHWEIRFAGIAPFGVNNLYNYDLVVLALGNSLFHCVLDQQRFFEYFDTAPRIIGIFGSQYRPLIDTQLMSNVVDRLDYWFARNKEDIVRYGAGKSHVHHLGDWLISLFPTTRWVNDTTINLHNSQILNNQMPLDRLTQMIQSGRRVYSPRLHTLLCAMCSAEYVSYQEERDFQVDGKPIISGKFGSLLMDIFGKVYQENTWFQVDREKVIAYKTQVLNNIADMRSKIIDLVG